MRRVLVAAAGGTACCLLIAACLAHLLINSTLLTVIIAPIAVLTALLFAYILAENGRLATRLHGSSSTLELVQRQMPCVMWTTDRNLRLLSGNGGRLGVSFDVEPYLGRTLYDIFKTNDAESPAIAAHLSALAGSSGHYSHRFQEGDYDVTVDPLRDERGAIVGCIGLAVDISERSTAEAALRNSEERFRTLARATNDAVWDWDLSTDLVWWSEGIQENFGYAANKGHYSWFVDHIHPEDRPRVADGIRIARAGSSQTWADEYRFQRADGSFAHVYDRGFFIRNAAGVAVRMIGGMQDISSRKQLEADLRREAFNDSLTGLPNRALFLDRLEHALATQDVRQRTLAVLFMDIDGFKVINDSLGHPAGDEMLAAIGARLAAKASPDQTLARFGGDEFAVLVEDLVDSSEAIRLAENLIAAVREPVRLHDRDVYVTASVGVAIASPGIERPPADELMREADAALYQAKSNGKDRPALYDSSMHARALERLEVETGLRRAVERGEFILHYQPEVEVASGRIVGVEALVRWKHPMRGLLYPDAFIPIAEETGLIVQLGAWVLDEACRQMAEWKPLLQEDADFAMSVNISARQLSRTGLARLVSGLLRMYDLEPRDLRLEITETAAMQDMEAALVQMRDLREMGIRLALDDFGTGYSSLSYLRQVPVDVLKLDRSFVHDLTSDQPTRTIVRTLSILAQLMHIDVTAEGIETAEELHRLVELGCRWGQGNFFARPESALVTVDVIKNGLPEHILEALRVAPRAA